MLSGQESYYRKLFLGRAEIEVDAKELYMGLSRSFIRILNKMLIGKDDFKKFKRLKDYL